MTKKVGDYQVPFNEKGDLLSYWYSRYSSYDREEEFSPWRDNVPFRAKLTFDSMYSGRSAKGYVFLDEEGHKYPMFAGSLAAIFKMPEVVIAGGSITANWVVVKKGQNYGIELYEGVVQ